MSETIVVGTDGSKGALEAVAVAGKLAQTFGADVHIVTACPQHSHEELRRLEKQLPREFRNLISLDMRADERLLEAVSIMRPMGITPTRHESSRHAADAILDVAEDVDADLIVVGARGLGVLGRFIRGSVSTKVAHHSPCNVLIVEHDD